MESQEVAVDGVIEAFNRARTTEAGVYDKTVGYGDKYPRHEGKNLVVEMTNSATGVHHPKETYERGFDQTHFGAGSRGARQFLKLLAEADLDPIDDFVRVYRDLGRGCNTSYPDYWLYTWSAPHVMIATTCNPLNGDPASRTISADQGYAGYIGISGEKSPVDTAVSGVRSLARQVKDYREDGLFF